MTENLFAPIAPRLTVIGEAIIDLVPNGTSHEYRALPGGSPYNVAVGLARLGNTTQLMARLADNTFGRILREHAEAEGIALTLAPHAIEPTTLAVISIDAEAKANYDFYLEGTADWQWTPAELAQLGTDAAVVHFGSLASWTLPGCAHIQLAVSTLHAQGELLISYDPNVRPVLMRDPVSSRTTIEACISYAHVVKASREDVNWLYPGMSFEHVAAHWHELGALIAIITDGAEGAYAYRVAEAPIHRPSRRVNVVDTIGAGDAFTAGLLCSLVQGGIVHPEAVRQLTSDVLIAAIDNAILVASLTCECAGADPPRARDYPELSS